jgi:hypothetical protein
MCAAPAWAGSDNPTFLPVHGGKVFLCRSAAEKVSQHRSRIAQRLAVRPTARLAPSLAAALLEELFEQLPYGTTSR